MAIIQKINTFFKRKISSFHLNDLKTLKFQKLNPLILVSFLVVFSGLFFITSNLIDKKKQESSSNLKENTKTNEFSNLVNFLITKINSPYEEINYAIKNNDTVEKILKSFNIQNEDIRNISIKLKEKT